jgi:RimJ/RimL family protein N-acetyltransferase
MSWARRDFRPTCHFIGTPNLGLKPWAESSCCRFVADALRSATSREIPRARSLPASSLRTFSSNIRDDPASAPWFQDRAHRIVCNRGRGLERRLGYLRRSRAGRIRSRDRLNRISRIPNKDRVVQNESLCPFESGIYPIPVGLQLVVTRSEFEFFLLFRDRMNADAELRSAYNELKQQASGLDEDGYRHAKSEFIESVLRTVNSRAALFKTTHFTAELLSPADLGLVIELNSECSDFYFLQNGQSPNEADARELFEQVPAQCHPSMKLPVGLFDPQKTLIGVLDVLRGYRTASDWYIGLMLLSPRFRGQGLGAEIHSEFVAHARQAGVKRLMLAVLEANDAGRRFWLRCGCRKIKDYSSRQSGRGFHLLSEFELLIVE